MPDWWGVVSNILTADTPSAAIIAAILAWVATTVVERI